MESYDMILKKLKLLIMRLGTLFSGIGSPEQAGMRVYGSEFTSVFACEWDNFARESFEANYNIATEHFHKDINDMDGKQYAGKVDVIVGGGRLVNHLVLLDLKRVLTINVVS